MSKHKDAETFRNSLAVGGIDGTIGKRMNDLTGRVFAKTGYIGGVRSPQRLREDQAGQVARVLIIYNGIDGSVKPYEELQDEAVRTLVYWPDAAPAAPATQPAATGTAAGE